MSKFDHVVQLWNDDAGFRAAFRADPAQALAERGIALTEEEQAALAEVDLDAGDAELSARMAAKKNC